MLSLMYRYFKLFHCNFFPLSSFHTKLLIYPNKFNVRNCFKCFIKENLFVFAVINKRRKRMTTFYKRELVTRKKFLINITLNFAVLKGLFNIFRYKNYYLSAFLTTCASVIESKYKEL